MDSTPDNFGGGSRGNAQTTPAFSSTATPVFGSPSPFHSTNISHTQPPASGSSSIPVDKLRQLVSSAMANSEDTTALFFADKLVTVTGEPCDVHVLALCLFRTKQYPRALFHLEQRELLGERQIPFRLIAAKCLAALSNWDDCLAVIEGSIGNSVSEAFRVADDLTHGRLANSLPKTKQWVSGDSIHEVASLCCLRADVLVAMQNRARAVQWYKAALQIDCHCVDAFDKLVDQHLLTVPEQRALLDDLKFSSDSEWLKLFYSTRLDKYSPLSVNERAASKEPGANDVEIKFQRLEKEFGLAHNAELLASKAERYYYSNNGTAAYSTAMLVKKSDPYVPRSVPIQISSLVDLRRKPELFRLAHAMVNERPNDPESWYAVGCYYYLIGKNGQAKRYFEKATTMDNNFACGWIGYGNAFAAQDETDQAKTAYRTASRLFYGNHLPALYIGMEYIRTNNINLAEKFLRQSMAINPSDPLVLNELGVVAYSNDKFLDASKCFEEALALCSRYPDGLMRSWEPILTNLGHCYRQLDRPLKAVEMYRRAKDLCPMNAMVHASLAFALHLAGELDQAIELYHSALALKPNFAIALDMLETAIGEAAHREITVVDTTTTADTSTPDFRGSDGLSPSDVSLDPSFDESAVDMHSMMSGPDADLSGSNSSMDLDVSM